MGKVRVTKELILDVIANEPLRAGKWVSFDGCEVCAVGGVMRRLLNVDTKENVRQLNSGSDLVTRASHYVAVRPSGSFCRITSHPVRSLIARKWMTALSAKFESLCVEHSTRPFRWPHHTDMPVVRHELSKWVGRYFPSSFMLDINGFEPRPMNVPKTLEQ